MTALCGQGWIAAEKFEARARKGTTRAACSRRWRREGIGTKATRAETISTLISRGYVSGDSLVATELGISVVETMQEYCPQIVFHSADAGDREQRLKR